VFRRSGRRAGGVVQFLLRIGATSWLHVGALEDAGACATGDAAATGTTADNEASATGR